MGKQSKQNPAPSVQNKKAWHNFELVEKVEAGIVLLGTEVKSLRERQCDLDGSYARLADGEVWLLGCKIAPYERGGYTNHEPLRKRKLLLHKNQIRKIRTKLEQRGFTLVPTRIYFNDRGKAKVELALATGKKLHDKRQALREKQARKDIGRDMKYK
ncbi:MAG TPA: SsrA-binding protein SmpB [Anaerohalosphaeraceae bacterium]|nr:SsrA-binding protein SmpB [Phycisphaerae bacterium]HOK94543.1 SsrA-binding protein SmpB [Anaerohalosphaeraceae bacterium]HOL32524.1 SsrA-binding protein SmpB [Anaerohalosphaeraceae bacterium]HOM75008.1 SsrA-binding protein SmpB [Anaerohalosphaeraceae bacterium]HPC63259.1 SsrA-binding protein SmpB [Anaerohalosphaeraceae bacterium]